MKIIKNTNNPKSYDMNQILNCIIFFCEDNNLVPQKSISQKIVTTKERKIQEKLQNYESLILQAKKLKANMLIRLDSFTEEIQNLKNKILIQLSGGVSNNNEDSSE